MKRVLYRSIVTFICGLIALIPAAGFYLLFDLVVGWTITWPVVAAVWWVESSILQSDAKRDGLYE